MKIRLFFIIGLVFIGLLAGSCRTVSDFDSRLSSIVTPYRFNISGWEFKALKNEAKQFAQNQNKDIKNDPAAVMEYLSLVLEIRTLRLRIESEPGDVKSLQDELSGLETKKATLEDTAEQTIRTQVREALDQQGIFNPIDESEIHFPPLIFELETPPQLLVISPRDRIESIKEITLKQDASREEKETIEARVDELGVSSLVVPLGGMATYPSFIADETDVRSVTAAVTEEWVHQYLVFKPLGFRYLLDILGIAPNYQVATMNETVASMASKEIAAIVYDAYYAQYETYDHDQAVSPGFDFNREMREIRTTVDDYLARKEIEQAEQYMEQKRQDLAAHSYYIRKLNQAYFAFYGAYADSPTSISPIGVELKALRAKSASLKEFLNTAAAMTSEEQLQSALNKSD